MLESNSLLMDKEIIITICNNIIKENNNIEKENSSNDICIKMIDYLMF
jgi:hypothetical protein